LREGERGKQRCKCREGGEGGEEGKESAFRLAALVVARAVIKEKRGAGPGGGKTPNDPRKGEKKRKRGGGRRGDAYHFLNSETQKAVSY